MNSAILCDDCYWDSLDQEAEDFNIYNDQGSKCHLCDQEVSGWICQDLPEGRRMICWPSCSEKLPSAIRLIVKDGKIVRATE